MYVQAAMAAASMISAHSKRKKMVAAAVEDAKLQRAKLEQARVRQAGDFAINKQRARESAQRREIQIEHSRLNAESKIDETFSGSGISGTSVDELDNEINSAVAQNKQENKKALDQNLADQYRANRQQTSDVSAKARDIGVIPEGGGLIEGLQAGVAGYEQGSQLVSGVSKATDGKLNVNAASSISSYLGFK